MPTTTIRASRLTHPAMLLVGILLIAANLRAPVTGVPPLLPMIQAALGLDTVQAGILTTLPLMAFALFSPFSAGLARRVGLEHTLFAALLTILIGVALRSAGPVLCLYLGTTLIGAGIALGNVLLPGLLKRDFPGHVASVTAAYMLSMGVVAALASMLAVPLMQYSGSWQLTLLGMALLPMLALVGWLPQRGGQSAPVAAAQPVVAIWRSPLAWQVTLFMGLNSFVYYTLISWLPTLLADSGYSASAAGALHGVMQLASAFPGLLLAPLVPRLKDQRLLALGMATCVSLSLAGLLLWPAWALLWAAAFGFGTGAVIILALIFMALRTHSPAQAAALSGMAQSVGYLLAAAGPPLIGALHDASGGWARPLTLCLLLSLAMTVFGVLAGRDRHLAASTVINLQPDRHTG